MPPADLSTRPTANLLAFLRLMQHSPQAECHIEPGLFRYRTAVAHPWFSGVIVSQPPGESADQRITEQAAYFASQRVGAFSWWVEPHIPLESWAEPLYAQGFEASLGPPGMVCDLNDLPESLPSPSGFEIQRVENPAQLKAWTETFCVGYGLPQSMSQPFYELMLSLGLDERVQFYHGFLNGTVVATSSIVYEADLVGIYSVAVLEPARGRGLGAAITLAPLRIARAQGYALAVLQSSEMGFNVYQRLGFRKTCDVSHFYFSAG